jgi:hypothetical protein
VPILVFVRAFRWLGAGLDVLQCNLGVLPLGTS